jgi:hypothetical protein
VESGKLAFKSWTPYSGSWLGTISSPRPETHVAIEPAAINGIRFVNDGNPSATFFDNVEQRLAVALYRLTCWVNASAATVSAIRHKGIGHGRGASNDCHNQGRAADISGFSGENDGSPFELDIKRDWGDLPPQAEGEVRLDPQANPLAFALFATTYRMATFEAECRGIGASGNPWPALDLGEPGGFVVYPDYVGDANLRKQHQDHIHFQIGKTLA